MADVQLPRTDGGAPLGRLAKLSSPESPAYGTTGGGWPGTAALRRRPAAAATSEASSSGRGSSGGSDLASADLEPRVVSPADSGTAVSPAEEVAAPEPRRRLASPADSGLSDGGRAGDGSASDDTVTPEYGDGDTSSVFSCDAEGYYTSFHIDSGLRGAPLPPPPPPARPDSRGSTVSAGSSVAGPRRRPPPPPRASSLDPAGQRRSPAATGGGAHYSGSETDGGEQFRSKTALTSGRIPSLCVVTPPASEGSEVGSPDRRRDRVTDRDQDRGRVVHRDRGHDQHHDLNRDQKRSHNLHQARDREQEQSWDRDQDSDWDRERTPRPEDGVGSGWVGDTPAGQPLKAPWGGSLSDWTGSSETGDSSGGTRTPPACSTGGRGRGAQWEWRWTEPGDGGALSRHRLTDPAQR